MPTVRMFVVPVERTTSALEILVISICNCQFVTSAIHVVRAFGCYPSGDDIKQRRANGHILQNRSRPVHMYVPTLMYLYVVRINYANLDIRIQHTLMYQTGLCHTNTPLTGDDLQW